MRVLLTLSKKVGLSTTWELVMTGKVWNRKVGRVVYCNDLVGFHTIFSFYIFAHTCFAVALNANLIDWSGMEVASGSETESEVDDSNDSDSCGEPPVTTLSPSTGMMVNDSLSCASDLTLCTVLVCYD